MRPSLHQAEPDRNRPRRPARPLLFAEEMIGCKSVSRQTLRFVFPTEIGSGRSCFAGLDAQQFGTARKPDHFEAN